MTMRRGENNIHEREASIVRVDRKRKQPRVVKKQKPTLTLTPKNAA